MAEVARRVFGGDEKHWKTSATLGHGVGHTLKTPGPPVHRRLRVRDLFGKLGSCRERPRGPQTPNDRKETDASHFDMGAAAPNNRLARM